MLWLTISFPQRLLLSFSYHLFYLSSLKQEKIPITIHGLIKPVNCSVPLDANSFTPAWGEPVTYITPQQGSTVF